MAVTAGFILWVIFNFIWIFVATADCKPKPAPAAAGEAYKKKEGAEDVEAGAAAPAQQ
jgi:hypothetical protein